MKKNKVNIILIIIFLIGLSVMLYPIVSDYWNSRTQSRAVASYNETVQSMTDEDYDSMYAAAEVYNEELAQLDSPFTNYDLLEEYEDLLDVSGTGIMGYITIEKIGVELPIYHGTSDGVLQIAVGHLEGSSLPVGGTGTHCVLSAHRGLPSSSLFTDLDELEEGDTFEITVLDRTLIYEVDQIRIVLPDEIEELEIDPEKDYCTLMTCTPYGINSHRLLVRGVRISGTGSGEYVAADAHQIGTVLVATVSTISILTIMLLIVLIRWGIGHWFSRKKS